MEEYSQGILVPVQTAADCKFKSAAFPKFFEGDFIFVMSMYIVSLDLSVKRQHTVSLVLLRKEEGQYLLRDKLNFPFDVSVIMDD